MTNLANIKKDITDLNAKGFSDTEIAKSLNLDIKYVNSWRLKLHLPKCRNGKAVKTSEIDEASLRKMYFEEILSLLEIGKKFNCSETTIKNYMLKLEIPIFTPTERRDLRNPNFKKLANNSEDYRQEILDLTRENFTAKYNVTINQYNQLRESLNIDPKRSGFSQWRGYKSASLTEEQFDLIVGSMLGDGKLRKTLYGVVYSEFHSNKQLSYLYKKADLLGNHLESIVKDVQSDGEFLITKPIGDISWLFDAFYPSGEGWKMVPEFIISDFKLKWLAYWFLDDGSSFDTVRVANKFIALDQKNKLKDKLASLNINISFPELGDYFEIKKDSYEVFFDSVKDIITVDMLYKIPEFYKKDFILDRFNPIWRRQWEDLVAQGFPYPRISDGNWDKRVATLLKIHSKFDTRYSYQILCDTFFPQKCNYLVPFWEKEKVKLLEDRILHSDRVSTASLLKGLKKIAQEDIRGICPYLVKEVILKITNNKPSRILDSYSSWGGILLGVLLSNPQNECFEISPGSANIQSSYRLLSRLDKMIPNCSSLYSPHVQVPGDYIPEFADKMDVIFAELPGDCEFSLSPNWNRTIYNLSTYLKKEGSLALDLSTITGNLGDNAKIKTILENGFIANESFCFNIESRSYNDSDCQKIIIQTFKKAQEGIPINKRPQDNLGPSYLF